MGASACHLRQCLPGRLNHECATAESSGCVKLAQRLRDTTEYQRAVTEDMVLPGGGKRVAAVI